MVLPLHLHTHSMLGNRHAVILYMADLEHVHRKMGVLVIRVQCCTGLRVVGPEGTARPYIGFASVT
jgi:hypothetical protein